MKRKIVIVSVVAVGLLLLLGAYIVQALYLRPQDRPWIRRMTGVLPIPVARVGSYRVPYAEYIAQQDAMRAFLRSPMARTEGLPTELDARANASLLDQLLRAGAVQAMADRADVRLRSGEVDRMYTELLNRAGTSTEPGEVAAYLQSTFGWSEEMFKLRVVRPAALETVVRQEIYQNDTAVFEKALQEDLAKAVRYIRL